MNRRRRLIPKALTALLCTLAAVMLISIAGFAESAGWNTENGNIYYNLTTSKGLVRAVGLHKIGSKYYYSFKKSGYLRTGWYKSTDGYRFYRMNGSVGIRGRMYTGLHKINGFTYYFDKNGILQTGFTQTSKGTFFFDTTEGKGITGRAITNKWVKVKSSWYYFGANGRMLVNTWVKNTWYVGPNGKRLKNTVTPDGYLVGSNGKKVSDKPVNGWVQIKNKWRYYSKTKQAFLKSTFKTVKGEKFYLDSDGVRVTGWQTIKNSRYYFDDGGVMQTGVVVIGNKRYYFNDQGKLQINATTDGYTTDSEGVIIKEPARAKKKILLIAGHGQGDSGATSSLGIENKKTREFAKLIYDRLKAGGIVDIVYYKNGNINYDHYQRNIYALRNVKVTGSGANKAQVIKAQKADPNVENFAEYDYVLEIHFNATAESNKDIGGNGRYKGIGFYLNSYKAQYNHKMESAVMNRMRNLGFALWGGGIVSDDFYNMRICREVGTSYGLLETAFIDDADDMRFYNANKVKMAEAVAVSLEQYYSS